MRGGREGEEKRWVGREKREGREGREKRAKKKIGWIERGRKEERQREASMVKRQRGE